MLKFVSFSGVRLQNSSPGLEICQFWTGAARDGKCSLNGRFVPNAAGSQLRMNAGARMSGRSDCIFIPQRGSALGNRV
jgi:hypothetical protein